MTESAYLGWIRSALRSKSLKWKPRTDCILAARRPYKGPNKLQKWEVNCAICNGWFKLKETIVDHHPHAAGSILSVEDIGPFSERLFCEVSNLRCLCVFCHRTHTLASSKDITWEDAVVEGKVNDIMKDKVKMVALFKQHGYTDASTSNSTKRKAVLTEILTKDN